MQKSARVTTARTIQFQENVQIREIPRNDEEPQTQAAWDPNLRNHDVFTDKPKRKLRKLVICIVITGIICLAIIIGVVVGVVVSQKSSTTADNSVSYNQYCTQGSNQCISSQGLSCPNGYCTCTSPLFWNTETSTCALLTYNQTCSSSSQCDSTKGLSCNNSICVCDTTKYWESNLKDCQLRLNYSDACPFDAACKPTMICPTVPGVCNCSQYLPSYSCNCANNQYYDSVTSQCVSRATLSGSCTPLLNYTCLTSLYCNAGICVCPLGMIWIPANSTCT